jgi:hypothetical protein
LAGAVPDCQNDALGRYVIIENLIPVFSCGYGDADNPTMDLPEID